MAISLTLQYDTLTVDDYAAAGRALDFPGRWPEGLLHHDSAVIDGKLRVYEVWNCRADFDLYAAEVMAPVIPGALGDRAEAPAITERELHTCYLRP